MNQESKKFQDCLEAEKIIGRSDCADFINKFGLDAARRCMSAAVLSNKEIVASGGYWHGWASKLL